MMNSKENYVIRKLSFAELDKIAIEWAAAEGWNPGLHDARAFYAADPEGFLGGFLGDECISCKAAVRYGSDFGFMGFYIVKPEHRGKGYGKIIWDAGMDYLNGRLVGMDGVVEQQANYKKSGFKLAFRNIRNEGKAFRSEINSNEIIPASELSFDDIAAYDRKYFPEQRDAFLKEWLTLPDSTSLAAVSNGKIMGYGTIRKCRIGYKIGPLFAETADFAELLFLALNDFASEGDNVYLDTPEINKAAVKLATKYNMKYVFETARMYDGEFPNVDTNKIFGITTFELG